MKIGMMLALLGGAGATAHSAQGQAVESVVLLPKQVESTWRRPIRDQRADSDPTWTGAAIGGAIGVAVGFVALYAWNERDQAGPGGWQAAGVVLGPTVALGVLGALMANALR